MHVPRGVERAIAVADATAAALGPTSARASTQANARAASSQRARAPGSEAAAPTAAPGGGDDYDDAAVAKAVGLLNPVSNTDPLPTRAGSGFDTGASITSRDPFMRTTCSPQTTTSERAFDRWESELRALMRAT